MSKSDLQAKLVQGEISISPKYCLLRVISFLNSFLFLGVIITPLLFREFVFLLNE